MSGDDRKLAQLYSIKKAEERTDPGDLTTTEDNGEHRQVTHTTHGYGSHKHNALNQEAPGDLTTTEDNGEHRQVTHTTHGYGSHKHNALN